MADRPFAPVERILFAGLGKLGRHLVRYLSEPAGQRRVPLYVYDVDPAPGAELAEKHGVLPVRALAGAPAGADGAASLLLCLCVPGKQQVREVTEEALRLGLLGEGAIVLDFSSVPPGFVREFAAELAERGVTYLDAPITGSLAAAAAGEAVTMVGGPVDALESVRWVVDSFSARVVSCGPSGNGALLKTVNNLVGNVAAIAAMEGIGILRRAGLEDDAILEVLNNGPAATYFSRVRYPNHVVPRTYRSGAQLGLVNKDLGIAMDALGDLGAQPPLSSLAREMWRGALARYGKDGDMTMMLDFVTRLSLGESWFDVIDDQEGAPEPAPPAEEDAS